VQHVGAVHILQPTQHLQQVVSSTGSVHGASASKVYLCPGRRSYAPTCVEARCFGPTNAEQAYARVRSGAQPLCTDKSTCVLPAFSRPPTLLPVRHRVLAPCNEFESVLEGACKQAKQVNRSLPASLIVQPDAVLLRHACTAGSHPTIMLVTW
jgi:hypothetical protein